MPNPRTGCSCQFEHKFCLALPLSGGPWMTDSLSHVETNKDIDSLKTAPILHLKFDIAMFAGHFILRQCVIFITCAQECADDQIRQSTKEQHISWISRNEVYKLDWYFPEMMSKRGSCPLRGSTCVIRKLIKRCYFCSRL